METAGLVFVVDDDGAVRDSLRMLLAAEGYEVVTLEDGEELVAALSTDDAGLGPAAVLLDVRMPGRGGLDLLPELRLRWPALAVVMITGHGDVPMAVRAMREGAVDFVEKPFRDDRVLEAVGHALEVAHARERGLDEARRGREMLERLTARERDVLVQLVAGFPNKVIAWNLDISPRTVEIHRRRVMEKSGVRSLSELVRIALAAGVDPDTAVRR